MAIEKAIDYKLKVKPAYMQLIHRSAYEGACRHGPVERLTTEFDTKIAYQKFKAFKDILNTKYSKDYIQFLDPELITWTDEFILRKNEMEKLTNALGKTDIFLFDGLFNEFPAMEIAESFKAPVGIIGCCASTDGAAGLRNRGLEAYGYIDADDANRQLKYMQVKAAMKHTRVLVILKNDIVSKGVISTITDLQSITKDLGVKFAFTNAEDLFDAFRNCTEEQKSQAEQLAKELQNNAEESNMTVENIVNSAKFYIVIRALLEKYECNAFTMPCFEICATRKFNDELKCTPCLAHTLLREEGIPSACESDVNALMAMIVLMYLTRTSTHMGNTHPLSNELKTEDSSPLGLELVPEIEGKKNIVSTWHAVQPRNMHGIDEPMDPYSIRAFTYSGWGATLRHDFNKDIGEKITLVRFHPNGKKMLVVRGKIVAGAGKDAEGCPSGIYYTVENSRDLFKKMLDFGHHYTWVYGDYVEQLQELGTVLGLEIVTA